MDTRARAMGAADAGETEPAGLPGRMKAEKKAGAARATARAMAMDTAMAADRRGFLDLGINLLFKERDLRYNIETEGHCFDF